MVASQAEQQIVLEMIRKRIGSLIELPDQEWRHAENLFKFKTIKKGEIYCSQGVRFPYIGFLAKGLIYSYYETEVGDVSVKRFLLPGDPVSAYPEIIFDLPASYSSRALEESLIVHMDYLDFMALTERHHCWDRFIRKSLELEIFKREKREYSLFMLSATQRYEEFVKSGGDLVSRIPQYLIASALGISPEALSRIRART